MRVVIQRVSQAGINIDGQEHARIGVGLLILLGIETADGHNDIDWLAKKVANLRIFSDEAGLMNRSVIEERGELLVVSQFTLYGNAKKGNRPSYIRAARPEVAIPLYEAFVERLRAESGMVVRHGVFGADMKVSLVNDGPVTILFDTKDKEF
jgi:D-tyrosyl-tRNA(Tyr) deacylase